jgi:hypothetical protein
MQSVPGFAIPGTALVLLIGLALAGCAGAPGVDPAEERRARAWWAVERATRSCMLEAGFDDYALVPEGSGMPGPTTGEAWVSGLPAELRETASVALFGRRDGEGRALTEGLESHELWRATGCHGRALHEVGAD